MVSSKQIDGTNNTSKGRILKNSDPVEFTKDPRGLGYLMHQKLKEHEGRIAQIDGKTGEEDTFENFRRRSVRAAIHIKAKGVVPTDKIVIIAYPTLNSTVPIIASFFVGAIPVSLHPTDSTDRLRHNIQCVKPKLIFVCPEKLQSIEEAIKPLNFNPKIVILGKLEGYQSFEDFMSPVEGEDTFEPFEALSWYDTALILFSSGSTGLPKPACLNHYYFFHIANGIPDGRFLGFTNPAWVSQVTSIVSSIIFGFARIIYPKYDGAKVYCELVNKYQINLLYVSLMELADICQFCIENNIQLLSPEYIGTGGCPVSSKYLELAKTVYPKAMFFNMYGLTEVTGISSCATYDEISTAKFYKCSIGKVAPGYELKIVDPETEEILGPNQQGDLRVKCNFMMNGYLNIDTSDDFDSDGFYKTGDLTYYDEDEYIYVVGRLKQLLKYKYFPVCPGAIEEVLLKHPAVEFGVVGGIPHETDGDHPAALVKLVKGQKVDTEEIRKFVDEQVDELSKLRGGVYEIDEIPFTTTGKPYRLAVQQILKSVQNGKSS